jgi:CBS domain-containing protein
MSNMQVRDVMTERVVTVPPDADFRATAREMLERRIGSVLVFDDRLHGIVTETDVLAVVVERPESIPSLVASDVMTDDLVTVAPDRPLSWAVNRIGDHNVKKLPVVRGQAGPIVRAGDLLGIVTLSDISHHLPDEVRETRKALDRRDKWTD